MSYEMYITATQPLDESDIGLMNLFLEEVAPIYGIDVEYSNDHGPAWQLIPRNEKQSMVPFMRSFYSRKYILKDIPMGCNIYIMGNTPYSQMMMQHNMAIMSENIHDNNDCHEYITNDRINDLTKQLKGLHEYNNRNHLYTFKFVVETLLERLSEQGLIRDSEGIKKTLFPKETATTH